MNIQTYLDIHDLWNEKKLEEHCSNLLVNINKSDRFPNLRLLHYSDEAHFEQIWSEFSLMCRGSIVDIKNKKVIAHPFDKFFNLGERPETEYEKLLTYGKFEVSEKLDGSMLILFQDPKTKKFHFTTKGSFDSDHGIYATTIIPKNLKDEQLVRDYTLMFELIDSKFRNVIDYKKKKYKEGIYLIGVRNRQTDEILSFNEVKAFAKKLKVPTFKTYIFKSIDDIIEKTKTLPVSEEGYVISFCNRYLLVKIKGLEYLRVHKFLSKLSDKSILEALRDKIDDKLLEIAPEEYREDIQKKIEEYKRIKESIVLSCQQLFQWAPKESRKEFALWVQNRENVPSNFTHFLFTLWDKKPLDLNKIYRVVEDLTQLTTNSTIPKVV